MDSNKFIQTGSLNAPPSAVRAAVAKLKSNASLMGHNLRQLWDDMLDQYPSLEYQYPGYENDILYEPDYIHIENAVDCKRCDKSHTIARPPRKKPGNPLVHYGLIGSANQAMKSATKRDKLRNERDIICFEMEAGGLMNDFPCLVIRGICG